MNGNVGALLNNGAFDLGCEQTLAAYGCERTGLIEIPGRGHGHYIDIDAGPRRSHEIDNDGGLASS
jgi:hypothetical protein